MRPLHVRRAAWKLKPVLALAALAALTFGALPASPAAAGGGGGCPVPVDANGDCPLGGGTEVPGGNNNGGNNNGGNNNGGNNNGGNNNGGNNNGGTPNPRTCTWHPYPDQATWRARFPEAPPDAEFGENHCFLNGAPIFGPFVPTWVSPTQGLGPAPPPPPTPAEVGADGYISFTALLKKPTLHVSPPTAATPPPVNTPTFVEVTNWQGQVGPIEHCLEGVCVGMVAVPELSFTPGETGSATIACEDGGTAYDRGGGDAVDQAEAAGACAHVYELYTGKNGRPNAWTGEVTITWQVEWRVPGDSGPLDPIDLTTTFDRQIDERPAVVTDYG